MIQPETTDKKPNKCCTDESYGDTLEYDYGDAVEWEVWHCIHCHESYVVDIEIVRNFENMKKVKTNETTN